MVADISKVRVRNIHGDIKRKHLYIYDGWLKDRHQGKRVIDETIFLRLWMYLIVCSEGFFFFKFTVFLLFYFFLCSEKKILL